MVARSSDTPDGAAQDVVLRPRGWRTRKICGGCCRVGRRYAHRVLAMSALEALAWVVGVATVIGVLVGPVAAPLIEPSTRSGW